MRGVGQRVEVRKSKSEKERGGGGSRLEEYDNKGRRKDVRRKKEGKVVCRGG